MLQVLIPTTTPEETTRHTNTHNSLLTIDRKRYTTPRDSHSRYSVCMYILIYTF